MNSYMIFCRSGLERSAGSRAGQIWRTERNIRRWAEFLVFRRWGVEILGERGPERGNSSQNWELLRKGM